MSDLSEFASELVHNSDSFRRINRVPVNASGYQRVELVYLLSSGFCNLAHSNLPSPVRSELRNAHNALRRRIDTIPPKNTAAQSAASASWFELRLSQTRRIKLSSMGRYNFSNWKS